MDLRFRALAGPAVVVFMFGCSGGGSSAPTPVAQPAGITPTTTPTPPAVTASPSPSPTPSTAPGASSCRYGKGSPTASCARHNPQFVADVNLAIEELVQQRPDIFALDQDAGGGAFKVLKPQDYYAGVIANLQAKEYCAGYDLAELQVKNSSDFSEQYDIMLSSGHIRKGDGAYRATCQPAAFPLDPEDLIDHVRVAFFGIRCTGDVTAPRNGEGLLPVGCVGDVTATPKKADGSDVDARVHGDKIAWTFEQEGRSVRVDDYPGVTFNKTLTALEPGHFKLCAIVKGREGCLNGEVPQP